MHPNEERIEMLSQESKVSKFCMDARFVHVVKIGQYFMTKDIEYTFSKHFLQEVTDHHNQNDGFRETQRIGPVLEVTTSFQHGKHGIEIRFWSLRQDNSHSWVRISHGSHQFVIDSNHNNTEIPAGLPEEQASQSIVKDFAVRSTAKEKNHKEENLLICRTSFR